jgi:hypothetical protein
MRKSWKYDTGETAKPRRASGKGYSEGSRVARLYNDLKWKVTEKAAKGAPRKLRSLTLVSVHHEYQPQNECGGDDNGDGHPSNESRHRYNVANDHMGSCEGTEDDNGLHCMKADELASFSTIKNIIPVV